MDIKKLTSQTKAALFVVVFTILFAYLVFSFKEWMQYILSFFNLLEPVFIGVGIAYVLNLPMKNMEDLIKSKCNKESFFYKWARGIALTLTYLLALVVVVLLLMIVLPKLTESIMMLIGNFGDFVRNIIYYIDGLFVKAGSEYKFTESESIQTLLQTNWQTVLQNVTNWLSTYFPNVVDGGSKLLGTFATGLSSVMISMYLLGEKERYLRHSRKLITAVFGYRGALIIDRIGKKANYIFSTFISKRLLETCILGVLYYSGMILFDYPFPELNTLILMALSLIPIFGSMMAMAIGVLLLLAIEPTRIIGYVIFFQIVTNFETYAIYPHVVGDSIGVSGFYVLLSIILFGSLFGMIGMLLAVPLIALIQAVASELVNDKLQRKHLSVTEDEIEYKL